jgi:hypothetical protein
VLVDLGSTFRMSRYASTGTTVSAQASEASSANVTVNAKGRKNCETRPPTKPSGRKTATVVRVLAVIAPATSRGPLIAAVSRSSPSERWRIDVLEHDDRVVDDRARRRPRDHPGS